MKNLKDIVRKQLKEMARPRQLYRIGDSTKADRLISLYAQTDKFKWIGDMLQAIKDAGENSISLVDLSDTLHRDYNQNKVSQEMNPPLKRLTDSGVLVSTK